MRAPSPRRWAIGFALTLAAFTALALWAALRLPSFRDPAVNFYAMKPGEYFNTLGLTRRQGGSVKLGFAESYAPPPVGAFGNHIIDYFGADAFDAPERAEYFFNYSYANLSMPEILRLMRHLEARGRLPTRLMIVQITPPDADDGAFIIDHGNELPPDILLGDLLGASNMRELGGALWEDMEIRLHEVLNYNTLILGLLQTANMPRLTGPAICAAAHHRSRAADWISHLPWTIRVAINPSYAGDPCAPDTWTAAIRRDGSAIASAHEELIRDADTLNAADRQLHAGDEVEIARVLREIDAIGRRHGIKVAFLIPPVFESERRASIVNQVLDNALARAPELVVIDNRAMHNDPTLFVTYLHPSAKYFHMLADQLRTRGLLSEPCPANCSMALSQRAPRDL